ncbi:stalk domain-containing protein [Paenibacillus sp. NPDC056722]|uniref:copper amine oxidase N-terminal domain-containing protein n=1 Tax=Paenibacillus sp. NPDC056722 TaxID=3345924 RepID=UPI00368AB410
MNFRKIALVAVLAVSQVAAAVPAFASSVSGTVVGTVGAAVPDATPQNTVNPTQATDALPHQPEATEQPLNTGAPEADQASPTPPPSDLPVTTETPVSTTLPTATPVPSATPTPTVTPGSGTQPIPTGGPNQLILMMNSNKMYVNGVQYLANQPMAVKNGVSYVSIRAMVERVGVKFIFDNKTKETVVTKGTDVMRFKTDSNVYTVNGKKVTMKGPAYLFNGTFMIPLTSITAALGIPYTVDNVQKSVTLTLDTKPKASFTVQPTEIYAGQPVAFTTTSSSPNGTAIVEERWEGKQDIYDQPGFYTVSYSVRDANGEWSNPYSVTINVLQPNQPPVANFTTDKDEYKMGEPVVITDHSYDPEGEELTAEWSNRALAYFNPGPISIQLKVTDKHGLSGTFEKTINITNDQMYTQDEVAKLFTPPGDVLTIDGGSIPSYPNLAYNTSSEPYTLIRSNSPETVNTEGVLYRETALGATRFLVHHKNNMSTRQKVYIIATNNNPVPATITTQFVGFAGPAASPEYTGKISVMKYYNSIVTGANYSTITLQPGQSVPILTDTSKVAMKPGDIISLSADLMSDYAIQYNVIMIEQTKDPLTTLPLLPILDRDGVHNRGTYPDSTRIIDVPDVVGTVPSRLVLGDNKNDLNLIGVDPMNGTEASNAGNFGVLYKIKIDRVAPNTLITFNPRGGNYLGSVLVNGVIVNLANKGSLSNSDMNAVLFRTGEYEGSVEMLFTVASGSNLPVNFVFTPLPAKK